MREIKVRGKRLDNGEFVFGFGAHLLQGQPDMAILYAVSKNNDGDVYIVDPGTVGQYLGVKDRNNKSIYEGDILVFKNKNMREGELLGYMKYDVDRACWTCTKTLEDKVYGLPYNDECDNGVHSAENVEVIGNIYENKELIP